MKLTIISNSKSITFYKFPMDFCKEYYGQHNTTDDYILPCLEAEMTEFDASGGVIWTQTGDVMSVYVNKDKASAKSLFKLEGESNRFTGKVIPFDELTEILDRL